MSCLTIDAGQVIPNNLTTEEFPATPTGNSNIDTTVKLPNPCVAPIVFVIAGSELKWFAGRRQRRRSTAAVRARVHA